ncbi:winged helix-turn-helix domain-containing protein [Psychrosphaera ytuae]|uniref:Winged helix-turn-helix domain-containing protein n=1 Tax=Psychrosphaera ytuae TaxID=2820710 RepID=A0A975DAH1_9GAMM|nr:winged helix-turn-helix domain-containing protein [Psychrosphaera ytuae]QTH63319.1 winged helix-turn-helix domain-containing protein [Psychrosphaera ytuae]
MTAESTVFFGPWRFTKSDGNLSSDTEQHRLPPRLNILLSLLLESAGQVVPREVIIDRMWGDKVVNEDALARAIAELRNLLGDSSKSPTFIETIPRRGYRFICVVHHGGSLIDDAPESAPEGDGTESSSSISEKQQQNEQKQRRWLGKRLFAAGGLMLVLVLTSSLLVVTGTWSPQDGIFGFKKPSKDQGVTEDQKQGVYQQQQQQQHKETTPSRFDESQALMAKLVNAKRVTTDAEIEVHPELSLNGDYLTYSTLNQEKQGKAFYGVTIQDTRTEQQSVITKSNSHLVSAMIGPNGKDLLAVSLTPNITGSDHSCSVVKFDVVTRVSQSLTECDLPDRSAILEWHPSGERFLFVRQSGNSKHIVIWEYDLLSQRQTQRTDLSNEVDPLIYDSRPRYSPDGESIAFLRGTSSVRNLYVQSLNKATAITRSNSVKVSFDWMPSGQALVFDSNILGDKQILMVDVASQTEGQVSTSSAITNIGGKDGQFPMINNSGTVAAYQEARYQANLWKFDLAGDKTKSEPIVSSLKYDNFPAFSPVDNSQLLYVSNRSGFAAIYQLDMTTQESQELLRVPDTHLIAPVFSPDGKRVLISAITAYDFYCYEFEVASRSLVRLPAEQVSLCSYGLDISGKTLAVWAVDKAPDSNMALVAINRTDATKVKIMAGPVEYFAAANTTQEVVFTKRQQPGLFATQVMRKDRQESPDNPNDKLEFGSSRTILENLPPRFGHSWDIVGKQLYFVNGQQDKQIWRKDFTSHSSGEQVTKSLNYAIGRVMAVSADESSLVVSLKGDESGNIFLYDGR